LILTLHSVSKLSFFPLTFKLARLRISAREFLRILKTVFEDTQIAPSTDFRGLFVHAWDISEDKEDIVNWMGEAGLNVMCLAVNYHHGWFIHPGSSSHRAFMTEGDVCYFHPQLSFYRETSLRPKVSKLTEKVDLLRAAVEALPKDFRLVGWTIGTHNTDFGAEQPHLTVQNVYKDRLPHALCISQRDVRQYLKALCRDLATNYPFWGLQLEAFGWMGFPHGHHHERDLVGLLPIEQDLMGLCFCEACSREAGMSDIDVDEARSIVKNTLDDAFREAPQRPPHHPELLRDLVDMKPELGRFLAWRESFGRQLITEIKNESLRGTECRLLLQSEFDPQLKDVVDGFATASYRKTPGETAAICQSARLRAKDWKGLLQCFVQLGMGTPASSEELHQIIAAVYDSGCNGINFYNHSEAPPKMLGWLKAVLPSVINARR